MAYNHQNIKARASEFLLSGPHPDLDVKSVHATARQLLIEISHSNDHTALESEMESVRNRAESLLKALNEHDMMGDFRRLSTLILREQLLVTASCIEELKSNDILESYPKIVKKVLQNCPKVMPQNSKIFKFLNTTVQMIRQQLLADFHKSFESHLVKTEELSSAEEGGGGDSSWESFLASARGWILAFAMLSLLPAAARGVCAKQLLEGYQECLDAAFTPLWGRFFFHLSSSRDAGSMEQILWTFEYTHTFVHLLLGFCTNLTTGSSDLVLTFPGVDFRQAGVAQIVEKTCRFMRSHVAECLVIASPAPLDSEEYSAAAAQVCISLLEHSLLLDHDIHKVQHGIGDSELAVRGGGGRPPRSPLALPVSEVFVANPLVRQLWLHFDQAFFLRTLLQSLGPRRAAHGRMDHKYASSLRDGERSAEDGWQGDQEQDQEQDPDLFQEYFVSAAAGSPRVRCCGCVYDCLLLFHKAYQRYSYLPREAQDLFCARVLEPLLLSALGLIMFRTNTSAALKLVFDCKRMPLYVSPGSRPDEGVVIMDTAFYLDEFLRRECGGDEDTEVSGADSSVLAEDGAAFLSQQFLGTITPPGDRFADNWALLQAWVRTPDRRYVSAEARGRGGGRDGNNSKVAEDDREGAAAACAGLQGFRACHVVEKAFSLAEASARRQEQDAARRKLALSSSSSSSTRARDKRCDLADVISFVRGESASMSKKLQGLLDDVASRSADNDIYLR